MGSEQLDQPGPKDKTPHAGPFAEAAAHGRKAVKDGKMTAQKAQELTEQAYRDAMIVQELGLPVEEDSIELPEDQFPPEKSSK